MPRGKRAPCPETTALGARLGKTVERLRRARELSISALSEQSGVAKSMISQIEKNEANPSVATLFRLSQALGTSVESIVSDVTPLETKSAPFLEHAASADIPLVTSEDGLCELRILSSLETVGWAQTYDFRAASGGVLESSAHPDGTIENLSILSGTLSVEVDGNIRTASAGETLRYRGDYDHTIRNTGNSPAHATMICLRAPAFALAAQ